ncbi:hypothetical protein EBU24_05140 [bacterium]|nr:hypothetical protein [bacterium]
MTPKKDPKDKLKVGAKTKYKPEYCDMLIEHRKQGLGYHSFAAVIKVDIDTLDNWCDKFPEFLRAKKRGYAESLLYNEKMGIAGAAGKLKGFNAPTWIFRMKCMFRSEYTETINVEGNTKTEIRIAKDEEDL